jgi:hypothetical protein
VVEEAGGGEAGVDEGELRSMFEAIDVDGSGGVTLRELAEHSRRQVDYQRRGWVLSSLYSRALGRRASGIACTAHQ